MSLAKPNKTIRHVYFIEMGMVSVVAETQNSERGIEVGIYGREGMGAIAVMLGSDTTPHHHYMQIAGNGFRISTSNFLAACESSPALRRLVLLFIHVFTTQVAETALVNGSAVIEDRLARWILMCSDRTDATLFPITHNFLAIMLGVRRSSVTEALHALEGEHLIKATRGSIQIVDRERLEAAAGSSYGVPEAEYRRLLGPRATR